MRPAADVLVAGATGALGGEICERLNARGLALRGLVRPGADLARLERAGVEAVEGDLGRAETLRRAVEGVGCVVSTATSFPRDPAAGAIGRIDRDGTTALIDAAEGAGAERFVFVSFKHVPLEFPLQDAKRAVEGRLRVSSLDPVVLQAGKFMDIWFSPLCGFDPSLRSATIFGAGTRLVSWVARADVAELAARAASGEVDPGVFEVGGPEALSQRDVVAVYEEESGEPWTLEEVEAAELERRLAGSASELEQSLAAVMLEAHLGAVTDSGVFADQQHLARTTVREFARRQLAV